MPGRRHAGFTLIELLVVIAIIAILASLILPAASRATERGRMAKCSSNLRQLTIALQLYADDHNVFPPIEAPPPSWPNAWYVPLTPYVSNWKANSSPFQCPSYKFDFLTNGEAVYTRTGPYGYNGNSPYSLSPGSLVNLAAFVPWPLVKQSEVVSPARMIALGDAQLVARDWDLKVFGTTELTYRSITRRKEWIGYAVEQKATKQRHIGRHQISFCDGHVESIKYETLFADTLEARRLWNRDNEPHEKFLE